jgi:hypothetical protein
MHRFGKDRQSFIPPLRVEPLREFGPKREEMWEKPSDRANAASGSSMHSSLLAA